MARETRTVKVKVSDGGSIKNTAKGTSNLTKGMNGLKKAGSAAFGKLDAMTGGLLGRITSLVPSINGVSGSFKLLRVAIIGSGIGALVIAVVSLIQAFKRSESGQNKMAKIMAVLGAVTGQFMDVLANIGETIISVFENPKQAIIDFKDMLKQNIINRFEGLMNLIPNLAKAVKALFKGDFSEAGKIAADSVGKVVTGVDSITDSFGKATEAVTDFVKETEKEMQAMARIADSRANIDKKQRQLNIDRAKADAEISELRSKVEDAENYTALERLEFSKQAQKKQQDIIKREEDIIREKLNNKLKENALGKSTKDDLDEANALQVELIQKQTALNNFNKLQLARQKALRAEARTAAKKDNAEDTAEADALMQKRLEVAQKLVDDFEMQKMNDEEKRAYKLQQDLLALEGLEGFEQAKIDILQAYKDKEAQLDKQSAEAKKALLIRNMQDIAGSLSTILGQQNKVGKAFALANAGISMYEGMAMALSDKTQMSTIARIALAAKTLATGVTAIRGIQNSKVGSGGSLSGGVPSVTTQAPSFNVVGQQSADGVAIGSRLDALAGGALKAYVVESEVTNAQQLNNQVENTASLG